VFYIYNLTEVVRQKGDADFSEMLNRLRVKPKDLDMDIDDRNSLHSRLLSSDSPEYPHEVLHIAATHKQLNVINTEHLNKSQKRNIFDIQAVDICHDKKTQKSFKRNEPLICNNATLLPNLQLCIGARVILNHNLDVSDGLTNGVIGTVTAVITEQMKLGQPQYMYESCLTKTETQTTSRCSSNVHCD